MALTLLERLPITVAVFANFAYKMAAHYAILNVMALP